MNLLDELRAAFAKIEALPPPPFLGSHKHFPNDKAIFFVHDRREYVLGGPLFWKSHVAFDRAADPANPWGSIPVVDLDNPTNRDRLLEAVRCMAEAMGGAA